MQQNLVKNLITNRKFLYTLFFIFFVASISTLANKINHYKTKIKKYTLTIADKDKLIDYKDKTLTYKDAYSTQTGHSFHGKLDSLDVATRGF